MRKFLVTVLIGCAVLAAADRFTERQREFWSFQRVKPQAVPAVKNAKWARTPVDSFILAKLEAKAEEVSGGANGKADGEAKEGANEVPNGGLNGDDVA